MLERARPLGGRDCVGPLPLAALNRFLTRVSETSAPPSPGATASDRAFDRASSLGFGLAAGAVAGAAVIGFLLGIGHRAGTIWRPLNSAAHTLLGARADGVWEFSANVTPAGGLVVLTVCAAAGVATARLGSSRRTLLGVAAAAVIALAGYLVHVHFVARASGGLASLLSSGELRALYLSAAVALAAGMRYAFPSVREAPTR